MGWNRLSSMAIVCLAVLTVVLVSIGPVGGAGALPGRTSRSDLRSVQLPRGLLADDPFLAADTMQPSSVPLGAPLHQPSIVPAETSSAGAPPSEAAAVATQPEHSAPFCGDNICSAGESITSCPADCLGAVPCGDGKCERELGEGGDACPEDCERCGDLYCEGSESTLRCPGDCPVVAPCGDGRCERALKESGISCAADCLRCGDGACEYPEDQTRCPIDCSGVPPCGDGRCERSTGESSQTCPRDCLLCGDLRCEYPETARACPFDCARSGSRAPHWGP